MMRLLVLEFWIKLTLLTNKTVMSHDVTIINHMHEKYRTDALRVLILGKD